jgi:hypothetical protein
MKKLRKVSRAEMKTVKGGIAKGMVRCQDPDTCHVQWGWGTGTSSNCGDFAIICGEAPVVDPCQTMACV